MQKTMWTFPCRAEVDCDEVHLLHYCSFFKYLFLSSLHFLNNSPSLYSYTGADVYPFRFQVGRYVYTYTMLELA